jgi:REP element-mobilizing transposase RayT
MTFFLTFACYGAHLHGDERGSVDRDNNKFGSPSLDTNANRASFERHRLDQPPYLLDEHRRTAVLESLREVCTHRSWTLLAAHVRTNHVHAVIGSEDKPEKILNALKAYSSRRLNEMGADGPDRKRWARHGSTRWLWNEESVSAAIRYVVEGQGAPMALFTGDAP